ncbi:rhodanese-like domain-containing protein [Skermanella sp. TT6]|uniref:Rhodanese-like domain-containing protein n=1 Tax=Skermanella cutis TaxID=2775420 RepID=A0ABX7B9Y1_9PROT|nr:rhodanese-like domain-containing protein [Skermanella sp. TT6]QQP90123.1 rhodanese-like domain-containing protein [Skermanella sp. TT6]
MSYKRRAPIAPFTLTTILAALFLAAVSFLAPAPSALADEAPPRVEGARTVDADGVLALIESTPTLVLFDNRREADFREGHIEGAIRLIDDDMTGPEVLAKLGAAPATPVLFYCNGPKCARAYNAARLAVGWGYTAVHYYYAGMGEWKAKGLPLAKP